MKTNHIIINRGFVDLPKVANRGRKFGAGSNMNALLDLAIGESMWDIPLNKMLSLRNSADRMHKMFKQGIRTEDVRISVRLIPDTGLYLIKRIEPIQPKETSVN